jgi:hypothetical protein
MSKNNKKTLISPFVPRREQQLVIDDKHRFQVVVAHRRLGKTVLAINKIVQHALQNPLNRPQYAFISPERQQSRKNTWDYFLEYTRWIPGADYNKTELCITIPTIHGSTAKIFLEGAEEPDRLRGMYFDGVIMDEVAQMPRSMWSEVIRPALSDRKGWATFIGTPKGKNFFYDMFTMAAEETNEAWTTFKFTADKTGIISEDELDQARREMGEDMYRQEYLCSFDAVIKGTYYGKTLEQLKEMGGIGEVLWNPKLPVYTAWDLGMNDKTVVWFAQQVGDYVHIIDYYENSDKPIPFYVNIIQAKPYKYGEHYLPHDAEQRHLNMSGKTRVQEFRDMGLKCRVVKNIKIFDGINAVRSILPTCKFDAKKCEKGLESLFHYRSEINEMLGVAQQRPVHDKHSHAADAFRYLALGLRKDNTVVDSIMGFGEKLKDFYDDFNPLA